MTKRRMIASAPEPLEAYVSHFDALFGKSNQGEAFRWYLEGLLLPNERNKTLTGLVHWLGPSCRVPKNCNGSSPSRTGRSGKSRQSGCNC